MYHKNTFVDKNIYFFNCILAMNKIKKILLFFRIEDIVAVIMVSLSLSLVSSSKFYYIFIGNMVISKHLTALFVLFLLAIFTSFYKNINQRIKDTVVSDVRIPSVTIYDQFKHLWDNKIIVLHVLRDYIPFLLVFVAYYDIKSEIMQGTLVTKCIDSPMFVKNIFVNIHDFIMSSSTLSNLAKISYKTHLLSIPVLAMYMYLLKSLRNFRELMFATVVSSVMAILISLSTVAGFNNISTPALFTTIVLLFANRVSKPLTHAFIPIATMLFIMDIIVGMDCPYATIIGVIVGVVSVTFSISMLKLVFFIDNRRF